MDEDPSSPITAYRWFQVVPDGRLAGARDVVWPVGGPLQARHVGQVLTSERSTLRPPLSSLVWGALGHWERAVSALVGVAVLVALGVMAGPVIAGVVVTAVVALGWRMARRRHGLADAIIGVSAGVLGVCAALLAAGAVWLFAEAGLAADGGRWEAAGRGLGAGVACSVMAAAVVGLLALYFRPPGGADHVCPAPPRRVGARWIPECGIYGYRTLDLAVRAASREWALAAPVVLARVSLWGRVFPYSDGYRAGWASIEVLYDDDAGQVEVPAAAYGLRVESLPGGFARVVTRRPLPVRGVLAAGEALRGWATEREEQR